MLKDKWRINKLVKTTLKIEQKWKKDEENSSTDPKVLSRKL